MNPDDEHRQAYNFWGLCAAALAADVLAFRLAPLRAAALLFTSQTITAVLSVARIVICTLKEQNRFDLWQKLNQNREVPVVLSSFLFTLALIDLGGNLKLGVLFVAAEWLFGIQLCWINNEYGRQLEEEKLYQELELEEKEDEISDVPYFEKRIEIEKSRAEREKRQRQRTSRNRELQVLKFAFMTLFIIADVP